MKTSPRSPSERPAPPSRRRGPTGNPLARNKIIGGAAQVFAAKGVEDASVEDILVASEVSRRTFYRFFSSKDDVLDVLHEVAVNLFMQALRAAIATPGPLTLKLDRCVDTYLGYSRQSGPLMRVLADEAQRPRSRLAPRRGAVIDELMALIDGEVQRDGGHPVDPLVLRGLVLAIEGMTRTVLERGAPGEEDFLRAKAAMVRIVIAGVAPYRLPAA